MTYWMSPWRRGMRKNAPALIADVAPSRALKRLRREVVVPLSELTHRSTQEQLEYGRDLVNEVVRSFSQEAHS